MKTFATAILLSAASAVKLSFDTGAQHYAQFGESYMPDGLEQDFTGYAQTGRRFEDPNFKPHPILDDANHNKRV